MNGHTHVAGGLLAGLAVSGLVPAGHVPALLISAALASPLTDIDHPASMYGRFVPLPGVILGKHGLQGWFPGMGFLDHHGGRVGRELPGGKILFHRGPTHSFVAAAVSAALAGAGTHALDPALASMIFLGVLAGYLSHLALDLLNIAPISLWWPFSKKTAHLRFPRIRVGSPGEWAVMLALVAVLMKVGGAALYAALRL